MRKRNKLNKTLQTSRIEAQKEAVQRKLTNIELQIQASHERENNSKEDAAVQTIAENCKYFYKYAKSS